MSKDKATVKQPQETITPFEMPADFQLVTPLEGEQLWWKPTAGAVVFGTILGRFARKGEKEEDCYYQIRVEKYQGDDTGVQAITGSGDEAKTVSVKPGQVINMDERSSISGLAPYAMSDGIFSALIHCLEKVKIKKGKTFWRMSCGTKVIKQPSMPVSNFVPKKPSSVDDMGASY